MSPEDAPAAALLGTLEAAAVAHGADVDELADLAPQQVAFLGTANFVPDPLTDGIGCDHGPVDEGA